MENFRHKLGFREKRVNLCTSYPIIPTPSELEITQMIGKPVGKSKIIKIHQLNIYEKFVVSRV